MKRRVRCMLLVPVAVLFGCSDANDDGSNPGSGGTSSGGTSSGGTSSGGTSSGGTSSGGTSSGGTSSGGTSSGGAGNAAGSAAGGTSGGGSGAAGSGAGGSGAGGAAQGSRLVGNEWFATDLDAPSDAPNFGFDDFVFSQGSGTADMSVQYQTGGPFGRPFVRQDIHTNLGEFAGAWFASPVFLPSQCSWGDSFFVRFSFMPITSSQQKQKIVILSRGDVPNQGRFILTVEDWGGGYAWRLQKDGGADLAQYPDPNGNQYLSDYDSWSHIQVEGRYSSGPGAADGHYRLWVNNNNQAAPDAERTGIVLLTTANDEPNFMSFSGYHQNATNRSFGWTDVRVGPTFDPNWAP